MTKIRTAGDRISSFDDQSSSRGLSAVPYLKQFFTKHY